MIEVKEEPESNEDEEMGMKILPISPDEGIEVKEEPEFNEDEKTGIEILPILPDGGMEAVDPLRIDNKKIRKDFVLPRCTGYILWCVDRRKELLKTNAEMSFSEISEKLIEEWRELPVNVKNNYNNRATFVPTRQSCRQRKPKEILDLSQASIKSTRMNSRKKMTQNGFESSPIITAFTDYAAFLSEIRMARAEKPNLKKRKTRYTAYSVFAQDAKAVLKQKRPDISLIGLWRELNMTWKLVSGKEKYVYRKRAKQWSEQLMEFLSAKKRRKDEKVNKDEEVNRKKKVITDRGRKKLYADSEILRMSRKGRVLSRPAKLADFLEEPIKKPAPDVRVEPLMVISEETTPVAGVKDGKSMVQVPNVEVRPIMFSERIAPVVLVKDGELMFKVETPIFSEKKDPIVGVGDGEPIIEVPDIKVEPLIFSEEKAPVVGVGDEEPMIEVPDIKVEPLICSEEKAPVLGVGDGEPMINEEEKYSLKLEFKNTDSSHSDPS